MALLLVDPRAYIGYPATCRFINCGSGRGVIPCRPPHIHRILGSFLLKLHCSNCWAKARTSRVKQRDNEQLHWALHSIPYRGRIHPVIRRQAQVISVVNVTFSSDILLLQHNTCEPVNVFRHCFVGLRGIYRNWRSDLVFFFVGTEHLCSMKTRWKQIWTY